MNTAPANVFISYAQEDEEYCDALERHLSIFMRTGQLKVCHRGKLEPGALMRKSLEGQLRSADIILFLVSAAFLSSNDCWHIEMASALDRHSLGYTRIVPIIIKDVCCDGAPFAGLCMLPADGIPISRWADKDHAWKEVVLGLQKIILDRPILFEKDENNEIVIVESEERELYQQRARLKRQGDHTAAIDGQLAVLRRRRRHGPVLKPGETLSDGRYKLDNVLGQGGFATVWKAYDYETDQPVAVKVLHSNHTFGGTAQERFYRGARAMAKLNHTAIVKVIEPPRQDCGFHYFTMEYMPGGDIRKLVIDGKLNIDSLPYIISQAASALHHAHQAKVIHRDVKPANILLEKDSFVKISDFDLVWMDNSTGGTQTGPLGSFVFAAPEVMNNAQEATERSDQYSLAMTILFILYGHDLPLIVIRDARPFVKKLGCSEMAKKSLLRALNWEPDQRFDSILEFSDAWKETGRINGIWSSHQESSFPAQEQSMLRLEFTILDNGGALVRFCMSSGRVSELTGLRAMFLYILSKELAKDTALNINQQGWMDKNRLGKLIWGSTDESTGYRNRLDKLLFDTRAFIRLLGLANLIETRPEQVRLLRPPGGVEFSR